MGAQGTTGSPGRGAPSMGAAPSLRRRALGLGRAIRTFPEGERARRRARTLRRLRRIGPRRVIWRGLERTAKWVRLLVTKHPGTTKVPVFIVGCNRSGTNMVCRAIGASPHGWDYPEREFSLAFNGYYLRADWVVERLVRFTPAPIVAFGSILDSQFVDELLARFDGARAVWVYRRYPDVANSCARMGWGDHLRDLVRWVARGELERLGARGRRVAGETVSLFRELARGDLTDEEAASLYWYLRNQLFFDLGLPGDARVLLVQYEDAVLNPEEAFRRIFRFLGFPYHPVVIREVSADRVGKHPRPAIGPAIAEVCDDLQARLDARYAETSGWRPGPDRPVAARH